MSHRNTFETVFVANLASAVQTGPVLVDSGVARMRNHRSVVQRCDKRKPYASWRYPVARVSGLAPSLAEDMKRTGV